MKVRVWIDGADGPSHDFELLDAPRVGDRVSVSIGHLAEEGVVASVTWRLQAVDAGAGGQLEGEPAGSVTIVHVICRPPPEGVETASAAAAVPEPAGG